MGDDKQDVRLGQPVAMNFGVKLPLSGELPTAIYANFVAVNRTNFDVTIDFAQVAAPTSEDELRTLGSPPVIIAKPVARIVLPAAVADALAAALSNKPEAPQQKISASETEMS